MEDSNLQSIGWETMVLLYDILTADELLNMNLDTMTSEDLQALLPNVIDLLDNIESIDPEDYELSEDECEQIQEDLEEKAEEVKTILQDIQDRLSAHPSL